MLLQAGHGAGQPAVLEINNNNNKGSMRYVFGDIESTGLGNDAGVVEISWIETDEDFNEVARKGEMMEITVGQRFGNLVVTDFLDSSDSRNLGDGRRRLLCRCDCGCAKAIRPHDLVRRHSVSCGCHRLKTLATANVTHGMTKTATYKSWLAMRARCTCEHDKHYSDYGGRGITIQPEWLSFEGFLSDMGERPTKSHSLERRDNDRGYCKDNCFWATAIEQANNKRNNRFVDAFGRRQTVAQWAREFGVAYSKIQYWVKTGRPLEEMVCA